MKNLKTPTSRSYQEYLISSLKNPLEAATFIETILEAEAPEPELLRMSIADVIEARSHANNLSEEAKLKWEKLDQILQERGSDEIYALAELLDALGFRLEVKLKDANP